MPENAYMNYLTAFPCIAFVDEQVLSLRKQPTFRNATTGYPTKWCLRKKHKNSIVMTHQYPDLGSASDWLKQISHAAQPIRSTTQIWVVIRHQYGFSVLVSETSFHGETSDSVAKCSKINAKSRICFTTELKIKHQSFCTTAESSCYCWLITYNTSMKSFSKWDIPTYLQ